MADELVKAKEQSLVLDSSLEKLLQTETVTGFEEAQASDFAIPFINILQTNSPQVDKKKPEYVEGAYAGALYNTVSQEYFETLTVVPFGFKKVFVEWVPRNLGGGFVAKYSALDPIIATARPGEKGKPTLPNGNLLTETAEHYLIVLPEQGGPYLAIMPLTSTKLTPSKKWMSLMAAKTATKSDGSVVRLHMYMQVYQLSTVSQQNNEGSFYNLGIPEFLGVTPPAVLPMAVKAAKEVEGLSSKVQAAYESSSEAKTDDNTVDVAAQMK